MTTVEAPVAPEHMETEEGPQPANPVSVNTSEYTRCASYREARDLAGRSRYEGRHGAATFHVAMNCWCVHESTAPDRHR